MPPPPLGRLAPRSAGRPLQLGGDVFVEPGGRVRVVPGAAIGVDVGIGGFGERVVDAVALLWRCRALHRRTHERMTEAHLRRNRLVPRQRPAQPRPVRCRAPRPPATPTPDPQRLFRGDEKQTARRRRQRRQSLAEARLDPPRQRWPVGHPEPTRELGRRPAAWELEQCQRIAARLGHDPITHALVKWAGDHGCE